MTIHTPLAQQIADEAGVPQNVGMIEAQLLRKSFEANRAAIDAAGHYERNNFARLSMFDFAVRFYGHAPTKTLIPVSPDAKMEFAKRVVGSCLNDEQRAELMIHLLESIDRIGADLRVETETCLAEVLSGVRF